MPDVQEVFRMATQKVRPDPGALERQSRTQRRRVTMQRAGGYALAAALVIAGAAIGIAAIQRTDQPRSAYRPVEGEAPPAEVEGAAPTMELLEGIWYEDPGVGTDATPNMFWFSADGTFTWGGVIESDSWVTGTYEVEGHRIRFTATGGFCGGGYAFDWDAGIVSDGRLEAIHQGSDLADPEVMGACDLPVGELFGLTEVSPTSPAAARIEPGFFMGELSPDAGPFELQGMWLVEGTGHLLRVEFSGSYRMDDAGRLANAPQDLGSLEVGRDALTLTSGTGSGRCAEGDVLVVDRVRVEDGSIRGDVTRDDCGRGLNGPVTLLFLSVNTP